MGLLERRKAIEAEIERTQKNKATEYHIGRLKGQLARIRTELEAQAGKSKGPGEGFSVTRSGDVTVALIGFPSVGKSSFFSQVTQTDSLVAAYEFTTLTCVPGKVPYRGAEIQLLDLPGIIVGAAEGKGRGKQVVAAARSADLILMMMDASKAQAQEPKMERELEALGLRLNQSNPNVSYKKKVASTSNLLSVTSTVPLTQPGMSIQMVKEILKDYRIHNAEVVIREDITVDQFIDVVEGNRRYIPCLYCFNKVDLIPLEEMDRLARLPHSVVCSASLEVGIEDVLESMWDHLNVIRVYSKKQKERPKFDEPLVLPRGATVRDVCVSVHRQLVERFKRALVWGRSAKHQPQTTGIDHILEDEDVVQIVTAKHQGNLH